MLDWLLQGAVARRLLVTQPEPKLSQPAESERWDLLLIWQWARHGGTATEGLHYPSRQASSSAANLVVYSVTVLPGPGPAAGWACPEAGVTSAPPRAACPTHLWQRGSSVLTQLHTLEG